ncbi:MAG TPA: hypothetical protein VE397_18535 [Stellaceae bacterium]|nr:hypothetical protein [Stellaceae bacterium]
MSKKAARCPELDQARGDRMPAFACRRRIGALAALAALMAVAAADGHAETAVTAITCVNPSSGTRWQLHIDFANGTVDANPARISAATISWHDAKDGGNYTLDRKSGSLTVIAASSTGGYFLHHQGRLKN